MKSFITAISILIILAGCRKDVETVTNEPDNSGYVPPTVTVNGSVAGTVTDENGVPAAGIPVRSGLATTETDENGFYFFKDIPLDVKGAAVSVDAPNYWHASRHVLPRLNATHHAHLALMPKEVTGQFSGDEGGSVSLGEGIDIQFSAYGLHNADESIYEGDVHFSARSIQAGSYEAERLMPGGLRGIDEQNNVRALRSFGMFAGIVHDPSGNILQPNEDSPANLGFIPGPEMASSAPPVLEVWYLDEATGYWRKSGEAVKEGEHYTAEIPHFSFWGLFEGFDPVEVSGTVLSGSGNPVANAQVSFWTEAMYFTSVFTDAEGVFQANLPAGPEFDLSITDGCNATVYNQNIGIFSDDTGLGDLSVPAEDFSTVYVSGRAVNCTGEGISTDYATVCTGTGCAQLFPDSEGFFDQTLGLCGDADLFFLFFDQSTGLSASLTEESADSLNLGEVELCEAIEGDFFSFVVNGDTTFYPYPFHNSTQGTQKIRSTDSFFDISIAWQADDFDTGLYSGNAVEFAYLENVPSDLGPTELRQASCGFGECDNITINVEIFSLDAGYVEGSFSGTVLYSSSTIGPQPNTAIEGSFKISL